MQNTTAVRCDNIFNRIRPVAPIAQEREAITLERVPSSLVID